MSDAEKTGPSLRDMAYQSAYSKRPANILQDKAKKIFASYSEQMAEAAQLRAAERRERKGFKKARKGFKALEEGKENKAARKFRKADKKMDNAGGS